MSEFGHSKVVHDCILYSHSYGLFQKREQISWVLDNLWKPLKPVEVFDPNSSDVQILKVSSTPLCSNNDEVLDKKALNEFELPNEKYVGEEEEIESDLVLSPLSNVRILYKKYSINIAIDISASMGALDLESGDVLFDRVFPCIERILHLLTQPVDVFHGIKYYPGIFLTLCAVGGVYQPIQVLYKNLIIEKSNVDLQLERIRNMLNRVELNESNHLRLLQQKHNTKNLPNWVNAKLSSVIDNACIPFDFLPKDGSPALFFITDAVFNMDDVDSDSKLRISSLGINLVLVNVSNYFPEIQLDSLALGSTQMYCHVANTDLTRFFGKATGGTLMSYRFLEPLDDFLSDKNFYHEHHHYHIRDLSKVVRLLQDTIFFSKTTFRCRKDVMVRLVRDSYNYIYVREFSEAAKRYEMMYNNVFSYETYFLPSDILRTIIETRDREGFKVIYIEPDKSGKFSFKSLHLRHHFWPNIELDYLIEKKKNKIKVNILVRSSIILTHQASVVANRIRDSKKRRKKESAVGFSLNSSNSSNSFLKKGRKKPTSLPMGQRGSPGSSSFLHSTTPENSEPVNSDVDELLLLGAYSKTPDVVRLCIEMYQFVQRISIEDKVAKKLYNSMCRVSGKKFKKKNYTTDLVKEFRRSKNRISPYYSQIQLSYISISDEYERFDLKEYHVQKLVPRGVGEEERFRLDGEEDDMDENNEFRDNDEDIEDERKRRDIEPPIPNRFQEEYGDGKAFCLPQERFMRVILEKRTMNVSQVIVDMWGAVLLEDTFLLHPQLLPFGHSTSSMSGNISGATSPASSSSSLLGHSPDNRFRKGSFEAGSFESDSGSSGVFTSSSSIPEMNVEEPSSFFFKSLENRKGIVVGRVSWITKIIMVIQLRFFSVSSKTRQEEAKKLREILENHDFSSSSSSTQLQNELFGDGVGKEKGKNEKRRGSLRWVPPNITGILYHLPKTTLDRDSYTKQRFLSSSFQSSFFLHKKWIWMLQKYTIVVRRILDVIFLQRMREGFELVSFEVSKIFMKTIYLKPEKDVNETVPFHLFYCVHFLAQSQEVLTEYWCEPLFGTVRDGKIREGKIREIISDCLYHTDREIVSSFLTYQYVMVECEKNKKQAAMKVTLKGEVSQVSSMSVSRRDFVDIPLDVNMIWKSGIHKSIILPMFHSRKKSLYSRFIQYLRLLNDLEIDYWGDANEADEEEEEVEGEYNNDVIQKKKKRRSRRRKDCTVYICTIGEDKDDGKKLDLKKPFYSITKNELKKKKIVITMIYETGENGDEIGVEVCECSISRLERGEFHSKDADTRAVFGREEEVEMKGEQNNNDDDQSFSKEVKNYIKFVEKLYLNSYSYEIYEALHARNQEVAVKDMKETIEACVEFEELVDLTEIFESAATREKLEKKSGFQYYFPYCFTKDSRLKGRNSSMIFNSLLKKVDCLRMEQSKYHYYYKEKDHGRSHGRLRRISSASNIMEANDRPDSPTSIQTMNLSVPQSLNTLDGATSSSTQNMDILVLNMEEEDEPTNNDMSYSQLFVRFELVVKFASKKTIRVPVTYISFNEIVDMIGEEEYFKGGYRVRLRILFITKPPSLNENIYEVDTLTKKLMTNLRNSEPGEIEKYKSKFDIADILNRSSQRKIGRESDEDDDDEYSGDEKEKNSLKSKAIDMKYASRYVLSKARSIIGQIRSLVSRDILYLKLSPDIPDSLSLVTSIRKHLSFGRVKANLLTFRDMPFRLLDIEKGSTLFPEELERSERFVYNRVGENTYVIHLLEFQGNDGFQSPGSGGGARKKSVYYLYQEKKISSSASSSDILDDIFLQETNKEPFEFRKSDGGYETVKPYWIILDVDAVHHKRFIITYFTPFPMSKGKFTRVIRTLQHELEEVVSRVNKRILLADLHDCNLCSNLLLAPTLKEMDVLKVHRMESSHFDRLTNFNKEEFKLDKAIETMAFFLTKRLSAKVIMQDLKSEYFNRFVIHNRLNMYVYRQDNKVFYFKVSHTSNLPEDTSIVTQTKDDREVSLNELPDNASQCVSPVGQFLLRKARSLVAFQAFSPHSTSAKGRRRSALPKAVNFPSRASSPDESSYGDQYVVLRFYGVDQMPEKMMNDLNKLVTDIIRRKSVILMSQLLERNRRSRLTFSDLMFLRPFHTPPHKIGRIRIPIESVRKENLYKLIMMVKMNARGFLHSLILHDIDLEDGDQGFLTRNRMGIIQIFCDSVAIHERIKVDVDDIIEEEKENDESPDVEKTEITGNNEAEEIQGMMVTCQMMLSEGPTYGAFIKQFVYTIQLVIKYFYRRRMSPEVIMEPKLFSVIGEIRSVFLQFQPLFHSNKPKWEDQVIPLDQRNIMLDLTIFMMKLVTVPKTVMSIMYLKEALHSRIQEIGDVHLNLKMSLCKAVARLCKMLGKYCYISTDEYFPKIEELEIIRDEDEGEDGSKVESEEVSSGKEEQGGESPMSNPNSRPISPVSDSSDDLSKKRLDSLNTSQSILGKKNEENSLEYFLEAVEIERTEIVRLRKIRNEKRRKNLHSNNKPSSSESSSFRATSPSLPKESPDEAFEKGTSLGLRREKEEQKQLLEYESIRRSVSPTSPHIKRGKKGVDAERFDDYWRRKHISTIEDDVVYFPFFPLKYSFIYNYHFVTNPASYSVGKGLAFVHISPFHISSSGCVKYMKMIPSTSQFFPRQPKTGVEECERIDEREDGGCITNVSGFYDGKVSDDHDTKYVDLLFEIWKKGNDIDVNSLMTMMEQCVNGAIYELSLEQHLYDLNLRPLSGVQDIWSRLLEPVKNVCLQASKQFSYFISCVQITRYEVKKDSLRLISIPRRRMKKKSSIGTPLGKNRNTRRRGRYGSLINTNVRRRKGRPSPIGLPAGISQPSSQDTKSPASEKEYEEPIFIPHWQIRRISKGVLAFVRKLFGRYIRFKEYVLNESSISEPLLLDPNLNSKIPPLSKCRYYVVGKAICQNIPPFSNIAIQVRLRQEFPFLEMYRHCVIMVEIHKLHVRLVTYNVKYAKFVDPLEKFVRRILEESRYQLKCLNSLLVQKLGFFNDGKESTLLSLRKVHMMLKHKRRKIQENRRKRRDRRRIAIMGSRSGDLNELPEEEEERRSRRNVKDGGGEEDGSYENDMILHPHSLTDEYTLLSTESKEDKLKRIHEELYKLKFHTILETRSFLVTPMEEIDPEYIDPQTMKRRNSSMLTSKTLSPLEFNIRKTLEMLIAWKYKQENEIAIRRICDLMSGGDLTKARITHKEMEDLVRHSRLFHICRFPLFFTPLRSIVFDPGQFKSVLKRVIPVRQLRKNKLTKSEVKEKQSYEVVLEKFLFEYLNFMNREIDVDAGSDIIHIIGDPKRITSAAHMPLIELSDSKKVINCWNLCVFFLKVFNGGLFIVKVSFQSVWSCVNIYRFEDPDHPIPMHRRIVFLRFLNHIKDELHLHSFVYDFHLRRVKEFIEYENMRPPRMKVSSLMHDFMRYYRSNKPKFKKNEVFQVSFNIKVGRLLEGYDSLDEIRKFVKKKVKSFTKSKYLAVNDVVSVDHKIVMKWMEKENGESQERLGVDGKTTEGPYCAFFCLEKPPIRNLKKNRRKSSVGPTTPSRRLSSPGIGKRRSSKKKRESPKIAVGSSSPEIPEMEEEEEEEEEELEYPKTSANNSSAKRKKSKRKSSNTPASSKGDLENPQVSPIAPPSQKKLVIFKETKSLRINVRLYVICILDEDDEEEDENEGESHQYKFVVENDQIVRCQGNRNQSRRKRRSRGSTKNRNKNQDQQQRRPSLRGGVACSAFRKDTELLMQSLMPYYRLDMLWGEIEKSPQEFLINLFLAGQNRVRFDHIDETLQCMGNTRIVPWDEIFEAVSEEFKSSRSVCCVTCPVKDGATKLWMVRLVKGWDEGMVFVIEWVIKPKKILPWVYTMKKWEKESITSRQTRFINKIVNLINFFLWKFFLKMK